MVSDDMRHDPKSKAVGHALSLVHRAAEAAALRCLVVDDMLKTGRPVLALLALSLSLSLLAHKDA